MLKHPMLRIVLNELKTKLPISVNVNRQEGEKCSGVNLKWKIDSPSSKRYFNVITIEGHGMMKSAAVHRLVRCQTNNILPHRSMKSNDWLSFLRLITLETNFISGI
ncbi:hypothetical protein ACTXT7_010856 [Hymenolepis weldensis]